jgi:hypothetical protein
MDGPGFHADIESLERASQLGGASRLLDHSEQFVPRLTN